MKRINKAIRRGLALDRLRNRYIAVLTGAAIVAAMLHLLGRHRDISVPGTLVPGTLLLLGALWMLAGMVRSFDKNDKPGSFAAQAAQAGPALAGVVACVGLAVLGLSIGS